MMMGMSASMVESKDYEPAFERFKIASFIALPLIVLVVIRRLAQKGFPDFFAGTQATDIEFDSI